MPRVRPSVLSGSWFPGDPRRLERTVQQYLAAAIPADRPRGRPALAVVPHAGYAYSGPTAGRLYGLLAGLDYAQVFVLAPSHRVHLDRIALSGVEAFATPLGQVPLAQEVIERLAAEPDYEVDEAAHAAEHAVEIQLPFLQRALGPGLRIVPLLVPPLPPERRRRAAAALAPWCTPDSLFVVSTDFTHYGAAYGYVPFRSEVPERLRELDGGAIDCIRARDPDALLAYGERTGITMCGLHAAALALSAPLPAAGEVALVDYSRSGDRERDYTLSVSYAALLACGPDVAGDAGGASRRREAAAPPAAGLAREDRQLLLDLARRVVEAVAAGRTPPTPEEVARARGGTLSPRLRERCGAFVTLTLGGALRGCIGYIEGIEPLAAAVAANAAAAARRDPRFPPVRPDEVPLLHLEISVLTPLHSVSGPADIEIGRHGILLRKGGAQAVFLPQVAVEQGWDRDTTLTHLALKAGLPPEGWRQGARFQVFEADVFAEERE